jgi:hypothetical protein
MRKRSFLGFWMAIVLIELPKYGLSVEPLWSARVYPVHARIAEQGAKLLSGTPTYKEIYETYLGNEGVGELGISKKVSLLTDLSLCYIYLKSKGYTQEGIEPVFNMGMKIRLR